MPFQDVQKRSSFFPLFPCFSCISLATKTERVVAESESKLYIINYYLLHDPCLKHTFCHLHSMFQQLYCSARATFYWISFLFKYRRSGILSSTSVNMPNSVNHSIPRFSSSIIISDTTPVGPAALPFLLTTYCSQRQWCAPVASRNCRRPFTCLWWAKALEQSPWWIYIAPPPSLSVFRKKLITHLFRLSYPDVIL